MRLVWVLDAALPMPLVNRHVWDDQGRLLGKADIFDPVAGVFPSHAGGQSFRRLGGGPLTRPKIVWPVGTPSEAAASPFELFCGEHLKWRARGACRRTAPVIRGISEW
jgi:hypothetical protein